MQQAAFNVTTASIDNIEIVHKIKKLILILATPTIERAIFAFLCPDYSIKPHAVLENIKQFRKDPEGNVTADSFKLYCMRFNAASHPFANLEELPLDACAIFIQGMEPDLKSQFVELYPRYADAHNRAGREQHLALAEIQRLGAMAERLKASLATPPDKPFTPQLLTPAKQRIPSENIKEEAVGVAEEVGEVEAVEVAEERRRKRSYLATGVVSLTTGGPTVVRLHAPTRTLPESSIKP